MAQSELFTSGFYRFFTTGEVGVTFARRLAEIYPRKRTATERGFEVSMADRWETNRPF